MYFVYHLKIKRSEFFSIGGKTSFCLQVSSNVSESANCVSYLLSRHMSFVFFLLSWHTCLVPYVCLTCPMHCMSCASFSLAPLCPLYFMRLGCCMFQSHLFHLMPHMAFFIFISYLSFFGGGISHSLNKWQISFNPFVTTRHWCHNWRL